MSINLNVKLDQSKTPWALDVDQTNNSNQVGRSANAQSIVWQLTGNAATGDFVPLNDPNPGFQWIGTAPPSGIFGRPSLNSNSNQLTLSDLNNSTSSTGTFVYMLRASIGGTVYSTIKTLPGGTTTDPAIINK